MKRIKRFEQLKENINVRITSLSESNIKKLKKLGLTLALVGTLGGCTASVLYLYNDLGVDFIDDKPDDIPDDNDIIDENDNVIDNDDINQDIGDIINDLTDDVDDSINDVIDDDINHNHNDSLDSTNNHNNNSNDNNQNDDANNDEKPKDDEKNDPNHKHEYGSYTYNAAGGNEVAYCKTCGAATYRSCHMTEWSIKGNREERHCTHGCGHTETRKHEHMHTLSATPVIGTIYGEAGRCHSEYYICSSSGCPDGGKVNVHDVGHSYGSTYEVYVGRNTYDQYQKCTVCGYAKCIGTVVHSPSPSNPNPTPGTSSPVPSNPSPSNPTPSQPDPTPSNPTPSQPDPTPSNPTPSQPDPTPSNPTPSQPDPTPSQPDPTPSNPTPSQPDPTPSQPDPTTTVPDPTISTPDPTTTVPDPTLSTPDPSTSIPDPIETTSLRMMRNWIVSAYSPTDVYVDLDDKSKSRQA